MTSMLQRVRAVLPQKTTPPAEAEPETLSISYDKLKLILVGYLQSVEKANNWISYAAAALSLWGSIIISNFPTIRHKFGLTGSEWQVIFIVVAAWASIRALYGFAIYLRRPRLKNLQSEILASAEIAREFRAICLLKVKGSDHDHRILVYRDPLWDCYLLPHYNMLETTIQEIDDPNLCGYVAGMLGISASGVSSNYISGAELRSRKHSEFWRQGTVYKFSFYVIKLEDNALPTYVKQRSFVHNGRRFEWLTISEMEADPNTRNRNLDMTRHLSDHSPLMLSLAPDSILNDGLPF
jgi:hypothetical protein